MKIQSFKQTLIFIALFAIIGFLALQVPLSTLVGSQAKFTLFDLLAPTVGAFIGILPAAAAILIVQAINTLLHGGFVDVASFIRPFPLLFGAFYFAKKSRFSLLTSIVAIILFNLHPVGRSVWYYSLFWVIPLVMHPLYNRFLFARSLGATFTAHAVGGALWMWTFNLPASFWQGLIPVVITERLVFALGISIVYVMTTNLVAYLQTKKIIALPIHTEKKYSFLRLLKIH